MTEILADRQYTLSDFSNLNKNLNKELFINEETLKIINDIALKVGAPTYQKTPVFKKNRNKKKEISQKDWINLRNFKKTQLVKNVSGIEAEIDKIRSSLNKLTKQNYKTILDSVISIIKIVEKEQNVDENISKISNVIFEIGSTNKFMSLYYAKLYKDIIEFHPNINSVIENNINLYMESFDNYEFVDPDENYDKFCENNKKNSMIQSRSKFIVDLMNEDVVDGNKIIDIINKLENKINDKINVENQKDELNEIFENLKILVVNSHEKLQYNTKWKNVIDNIILISELDSYDYESLSNKMIFKCSDILETLDIEVD